MGIKIGDNNKIKNSIFVGGNQKNANKLSENAAKQQGFWREIVQGTISNLLFWTIITIIIVAIAIILQFDLIATIKLIFSR